MITLSLIGHYFIFPKISSQINVISTSGIGINGICKNTSTSISVKISAINGNYDDYHD